MDTVQFTLLKGFFDASSFPRPQDLKSGLKMFAKNERIIAEGEPATDFHLICRGWVQLVKQRPGGQLSRTATLSKGSSLGLPAVLTGSAYTASALALTLVHTYPIPRAVLRQFLETHPDYYQYLAQQLARTLLHYEKMIA